MPDPQVSNPPSNPLRGIALKVASVFVFMAMSTCVKFVAIDVPTGEVVFFRSFFAIPVIFAWLWMTHDVRDGLTSQIYLPPFRILKTCPIAVVGTISIICF
jgi:drug/metabolite transporter (DMT)-like permease